MKMRILSSSYNVLARIVAYELIPLEIAPINGKAPLNATQTFSLATRLGNHLSEELTLLFLFSFFLLVVFEESFVLNSRHQCLYAQIVYVLK